MSALWREWYRRIDRLQRTTRFRIVAAAVVLLLGAGTWGPLLVRSIGLEGERRALVSALDGQSLERDDEHAKSLRETGTVTLDGLTYGGAVIAERPELIFDASGAIEQPRELAEFLLRTRYPEWAPRWLLEQSGTTWLLAVVSVSFLLLVVWMGLGAQLLLAMGTTVLAALGAAFLGGERWIQPIATLGVMTFAFILLVRAAMVLYDRPRQVLAVAHTVLAEASRTRIPLVFIVLLLVILPLIPLGLDPDAPLRFRIQTFISRSLGATFYLSACMTLFLSCATVAFEIRDRQIWQLMTKPVHHIRYLAGKWLGVVTVNFVVLAVAGLATFSFVQYLRERETAPGLAGEVDAQQVRDAVLTARLGTRPEYEMLDATQLRARVDEEISRDPDLSRLDEVPMATRRAMEESIREAFATGQRTIPPDGGGRLYRFAGLSAAKRLGATLTLRYRFHILRSDEHETYPAVFEFNEDQTLRIQRTYVPTMAHVLAIPPTIIRDDGTLTVTIYNLHHRRPGEPFGALNFEADDFELLYKVGTFEANFIRAVAIDWIKLAFLAMLGISCATYLSFPVACLMSFTIFLAGTIAPFLAISLEHYEPLPVAAIDWTNAGMVIRWAFESVVRAVALSMEWLLQAFGRYRPVQRLVEGRLIPWSDLAGSLWRIGIVWSGLALASGWIVLRRRQLAIYSGHG